MGPPSIEIELNSFKIKNLFLLFQLKCHGLQLKVRGHVTTFLKHSYN